MNEIDLKNILATTASVSTILQFLTGILLCQKIVQNKSTGDLSPFPFVSGCLSTSLWLRYGFMLDDRSLILVNTIGATLFLAYIITFYVYTLKKSVVTRQCIACAIFLVSTLVFVHHSEDYAAAKRHLGYICCMVTVLFFAAPLASLLHVIKVKSTESLPYQWIVSTFIVSLQWFLYGVLLKDSFVQIPNMLGCLLSTFQLCLFLIYPRNKNKLYNSDLI